MTRATECTEQDLKELRQFFNQMCSEMKMSLGKLTHEREMIHQELKKYLSALLTSCLRIIHNVFLGCKKKMKVW